VGTETILLLIVLAPLAASVLAGFLGRYLGRVLSHALCIAGVAVSFGLSSWVLSQLVGGQMDPFNGAVYTWAVSDGMRMEVGFLVDNLSALMMTVVTFVSLMVHVYTIGYMHDDPGYTRFFSYISLFTFSMLMLVMSNNFLQLFFGWEAVGLVSYLLIGFWYQRPTAIFANFKAFVVNRVGDFGFVLGIAGVAYFTGTLDYAEAFSRLDMIVGNDLYLTPGEPTKAITVICILLFIGAMGKSAQVPLHVWLPDSMEGPTPISALIHAATMVTAGIFMVARLSPLFELSEAALSFILIIGATTALFMGLLGLVNNDIKRVVAYSTLSQLGYMTVALGAGAYAAGIFMVARLSPLFELSEAALSFILIIEAVHESHVEGAKYAYWCVLIGVFVTALYSFRLVFMTFHGKERMDEHTREHLHESPWVVTLPLVALAVPSIFIGWFTVGPVALGDFFQGAIFQSPHGPLAEIARDYHGPAGFVLHAFAAPAVYLAGAGVLAAWFLYLKRPDIPAMLQERFATLYRILEHKYYFDWFNENVIATGARSLGRGLWKRGDENVIDGWLVNGSANAVGRLAGLIRHLQTGYLYHYAFAMVIGLSVLLAWLLLRS
jgi:NADH-quinone oxidoreductase subunit L